jgi:Flp pilus assembly pilin Flp
MSNRIAEMVVSCSSKVVAKVNVQKRQVVDILQNEEGATFLEYVALAVFVFGFLAAALVLFRDELNTIFAELQTALQSR